MTATLLFQAIVWTLACCTTHGYASKKPPFVTRQDLCGIWKLSPCFTAGKDDDETNASIQKEVVVCLKDDGTFEPQISEDINPLLCRGGCWDYRDKTLVLATNRPPQQQLQPTTNTKEQVNDTLLVGKLAVQVSESLVETNLDRQLPIEHEIGDEEQQQDQETSLDVHLSIEQGEISTGKFIYPKKHKAFFDEPILFPRNSVGTFDMQQVLGNLNTRLKNQRAQQNNHHQPKLFRQADFYNRTFYLTASTHPVNPVYAQMDPRYDEDKDMMDIRVMPITFFPNNTFCAVGTEKILRGRFGVSASQEQEKLWFQVSLFGAGRSAPGSVYSQGRLLSKDDQRGYVGDIQGYTNKMNETAFFVKGEFYYGEDLLNPRKTRSFGSFTLQEMDDEEEYEDDEIGDAAKFDEQSVILDDDEDAFQ